MTWKYSRLVHQLKSEWCQHKGGDYGFDKFFSEGSFIILSGTKKLLFSFVKEMISCGKCSNSTFCSFDWGSHNGWGGWQLFPSACRSRPPTDQVKTKGSCNQKLLLTICVESAICMNIFSFPPSGHDSVGALLWHSPDYLFYKGKRIWNGEKIIF